ncbi:hypothetical protein M3182_08815 [Mesobacillus maritimus]|uniref:hypothetical protein n=1 Tax=Mesobacillus maritimus TaxID=1643336 RepID=UPI0020426442|nr:hypothetical protein [Mesobacillus maritimus]MCM3585843.1 hypothetical protein [Mesobacillus maritimus]
MQSDTQYPIWAWVVLIGGAIFLVSALPGFISTLLIPLWKPDELGMFSMLFSLMALCFLFFRIWGMRKAYQALKAYQPLQKQQASFVSQPQNIVEESPLPVIKKPIWPWFFIVPGVLLLIGMGSAVLMLPIMPLFLAGMSTDSGTVPDYVPILIILVGYGVMIGFTILLVLAIRALRKK